MGQNKTCLKKQLKMQDAPPISEIFLATCDRNNDLRVYKKITSEIKKDIFI